MARQYGLVGWKVYILSSFSSFKIPYVCMYEWVVFVGNSYGSGSRIKLAYTRKIIDAIHSGSLLKANNYKKTEVFGLDIPTQVDGVPSEILDPVNTVR